MTDSDKAKSIKARLLNMADGDNKKYQQLIVRFLHERLLYRLSKSAYRERFILKGGALLYAFGEFVPRPTLDMDFMGRHIDNDKENILEAFRKIAAISYPEDGITFQPQTMSAENITVEKKYPGVRISMGANIGTYRQNLTLDVGFGDVIIPRPMELEYPTIFETTDEPSIMAYSLETVVAEKFQTMIDRGRFNSRMKDYFDLYRILSVHSFEETVLLEAIASTFRNRGTEYVGQHDFFSDDFGNDKMLNLQWNNYIRKMKLDLPPFMEVHKSIANYLLPFWEQLKNA